MAISGCANKFELSRPGHGVVAGELRLWRGERAVHVGGIESSMRSLLVIFAVVTIPMLSGCIVGEMRDDLKATRVGVEKLAVLTPALEKSNAALERANEQMAAVYRELEQIRLAMEAMPRRVDEANEHLRRSTELMSHLEPMQGSLRNLDESLAALRKMVENIDKAIPLVNLMKGVPPAEKTREPETAPPR